MRENHASRYEIITYLGLLNCFAASQEMFMGLRIKELISRNGTPPPTKNILKLNVDAAVNSKDQKTGLGTIVRDAEGKILAVGIKQAQFRERVSLAEAEAILWGLQVAKQVSSSSLILESNWKEVVELLNNTKGSRTEIYWILFDVHRESKDFQQVQFSFIPRTCNTYAHALTKFALSNSSTDVWINTLPVEVQNVMNCVVF